MTERPGRKDKSYERRARNELGDDGMRDSIAVVIGVRVQDLLSTATRTCRQNAFQTRPNRPRKFALMIIEAHMSVIELIALDHVNCHHITTLNHLSHSLQ